MAQEEQRPEFSEGTDILDQIADVDEFEVPSSDVVDGAAAVSLDHTVELGGRTFTIDEPSLDITLRILNSLGRMALRGERAAEAVLRNPTSRAALWGLLAVVDPQDLEKLGAALLQFEDEREGKKFVNALRGKGKLRVAPLVRAFFLNWSQSTDLQEALANFTAGVMELQAALSLALPTFMAATPATPEAETEQEGE